MTAMPPAGWYPAPHANNEMRYWDGEGWVDPPVQSQPVPHAASAPNDLSTAAMPSGNGSTTAATTVMSPPPSAPPTPNRSPNLLAICALVLGIVAFLSGLIPFLGLLLAAAAIVAGVFALLGRQSKPLAWTGLGLGGVAAIAGLIATISFTTFLASPDRASDREATAVPLISPSDEPVAEQAEEEAAVETETEAEPAAEPVAPEPPVADGSATSPLPQPYVAKGLLGGEKYSLTGRIVDANASGLVSQWNQFNSSAPAGFKYVIVELSMTGIDPDGVEPSLAEWDLYLATSEGNRYSSEFIVFGEGMPSMSEGPTLYPGNSFTGYTAYIVPESAQSFLLYDNGNYVVI